MEIKLSAVIPAYNEQENITGVLKGLKHTLASMPHTHEIIVIDDGSTDATGEEARECGAKVIRHDTNLGYGRSLKDAIRASRGEFILLIDGDGTYDITKVPEMFGLAQSNDMVVGRRVFSERRTTFFKDLTRAFFANLVSYYTGERIEDLNSGQRIFRRRDIIDKLDRFPDGFSFSSTTTVKFIQDKKKIVYIPVKYNHRPKGSKFLSGLHVFSIARLTLKLTFETNPLKVTLQLALVFAAAAAVAIAVASATSAGVLWGYLIFLFSLAVSFFTFLYYIHFMGRRVR